MKFKTAFRDQLHGMFVVDVCNTLVRRGRDRKDLDSAQPVADYMQSFVLPVLAQLLNDSTEKPVFVPGVLQDDGQDWDAASLQSGRELYSALLPRTARGAQVAGSPLVVALDKVEYFVVERQKFLADPGVVVTAHTTNGSEPQTLLRLVYVLLSVSKDDISCLWLYQYPQTLEALASMLVRLSEFNVEEDPHQANETVRSRRERTIGLLCAVVPTLFVLLDNLVMFLDTLKSPPPTFIAIWLDTLWPALQRALSATTDVAPGVLMLKFQGMPQCPEICNVLFRLRRRDSFLFYPDKLSEDAFRIRAPLVRLLAYDLLHTVVCRFDTSAPQLQEAAVTHLVVLLDAVLTREGPCDGNPRGQLELIDNIEFAALDFLFKVS
jgi:hypothetical protein